MSVFTTPGKWQLASTPELRRERQRRAARLNMRTAAICWRITRHSPTQAGRKQAADNLKEALYWRAQARAEGGDRQSEIGDR